MLKGQEPGGGGWGLSPRTRAHTELREGEGGRGMDKMGCSWHDEMGHYQTWWSGVFPWTNNEVRVASHADPPPFG